MMNNQQRLEFPLPTLQPSPVPQVDYPGRRSRGRLVIASSLLVTGSLLLISVLLFAVWGSALLTPHAQDQAQVTHATPDVPQATPSVQATPTLPGAQIVSQVDHLLTNQVSQQQFSGSVLIARDGQVLLSKGYSMANWDQQMSNTPHTRFYIGSTTKEFTAMAILILQEQGKLHVSDHLCSYITPCPAPWKPVTIHQVLTHTSGIPPLDDSLLSSASPQAWIASYNPAPLTFTPGSQFSYCNQCYQILGYLVEQVSGKPYSQFLQQAIFDRLHMKNTGFDLYYLAQPGNEAVGYAGWQATAFLEWSDTPQWSFLLSSGLLSSTVEDLYRWDQALYTHALVSQQTLDAAFTPYVTSQYAGSSYGYGWFIAKAPAAGHRLIWHDGRIDGFRTYIARYVDDRVTIIFLSNLATLDELALGKSLEQIVFART